MNQSSVIFLCTVLALCYVATEAAITCPPVDPQKPVFVEDPKDCASFYECSNGKAVHLKCSPGTYFDSQKGCVWTEKVNCGQRPTTPQAESTTQPISTSTKPNVTTQSTKATTTTKKSATTTTKKPATTTTKKP